MVTPHFEPPHGLAGTTLASFAPMSQLPSTLLPHLLHAGNFTPAAPTPWGGRKIAQYKVGLGIARELTAQPVGEAWELAFGPELPSRTSDGMWLRDLVSSDRDRYLGREA